MNSPTVFVSSINQEMYYSDFVAKLFKVDTEDMEHLHVAIGVCGESGELADAIKKHVIYGKELDRKNIVEELGDMRFYMQQLMNMHEITEEEILQGNANKLSKRYPAGEYSNGAAVARLDKLAEEAGLLDNVVNQTIEQTPVGIHWGLTKEQLGSN